MILYPYYNQLAKMILILSFLFIILLSDIVLKIFMKTFSRIRFHFSNYSAIIKG
jgi:hypothetical protein